jgi:hypothetical protein
MTGFPVRRTQLSAALGMIPPPVENGKRNPFFIRDDNTHSQNVSVYSHGMHFAFRLQAGRLRYVSQPSRLP